MKILFIEDNRSLVKSLRQYFGEDYKIESVTEGGDGLEKGKSGAYDAIVLDLNLPDMDGKDVCAQLRRSQVTTPILVLSATMDPATKVSMLKAGADDYMTKPFHGVELKARLQALLRRGHFDPDAPYLLKVDTLVLDPSRRSVTRKGKEIDLRRKEFDILEYLIRNRGKIVTRSMIMDNVWAPDTQSWNNTVDVHIKYLRDKVDRPFGSKLIRTAYGLGYTIKD